MPRGMPGQGDAAVHAEDGSNGQGLVHTRWHTGPCQDEPGGMCCVRRGAGWTHPAIQVWTSSMPPAFGWCIPVTLSSLGREITGYWHYSKKQLNTKLLVICSALLALQLMSWAEAVGLLAVDGYKDAPNNCFPNLRSLLGSMAGCKTNLAFINKVM